MAQQQEPGAGARVVPAAPATSTAGMVYEHLLRRGPHARTDLADQLGLSGPTLTRITRELLDAGLLRELPPRPRAKGRPQQPLDVDEEHARFLGVKITATDVYAAVMTVRGTEVAEARSALPGPSADDVVATTVALCSSLLAEHAPLAGVGVGIGAQVDETGAVLSSTLLPWDGPVPLRAQLEEHLRVPVCVGNDFHALLEGLAWWGIGRSYRDLAVITIGAGVGIGSVIDGQVHRGRRHLAGVTGRLSTITRDGRGVPLREVASTDRILAAAGEAGAGGLDQLIADARAGDAAALAVADDVAHAVAVAAAGLVGVLDPEALILGGEAVGLLDAGDWFEPTLREHLSRVMRDVEVLVLPDDFEDWARGAAVQAVRRFIAGG